MTKTQIPSVITLYNSIYEDKSGNLWICTAGGLSKVAAHEILDPNDSIKFVNYKNNPEDPYSLSDDYIISAYEDNEGVLWIGTASGDKFT